MANICYSAVVLDNLDDFKKTLSYAEKYELENADYLGSAVWCGKYIIRFESNWKPSLGVGSRISRECHVHLVLWYQETGCGLAGTVEFNKYGEKIKTHTIKCEITNTELRECLFITDWEGVKWEETFGEKGEYSLKVDTGHRYPGCYRVQVRTFNDEDREVILRQQYASDFDLSEVIDEFEKRPDFNWHAA